MSSSSIDSTSTTSADALLVNVLWAIHAELKRTNDHNENSGNNFQELIQNMVKRQDQINERNIAMHAELRRLQEAWYRQSLEEKQPGVN